MNSRTDVNSRRGRNRAINRWSSIAVAAAIAVAFASSLASAQVIHGCVSATGALVIKPKCAKNQTALTWNVPGPPGPAGDSGVQGPPGPAGSGTLSAMNVQSLNLVDASNNVLATLTAAPSGGGALTFLDSNGKRFILVGESDDGTRVGLSAYDGNTLAPGTGVLRALFGTAGTSSGTPGIGMGIAGANNTLRLSVISSLDGTTTPSNMGFYDGMGKLTDAVGLFPNFGGMVVLDGNSILPGTGTTRNAWGVTSSIIGNLTFDANGKLRTSWGDLSDESVSSVLFNDANGALRSGVEYFPGANFNGFFTMDGNAHDLSDLGNVLGPSGILAANDPLMQLFDTTGQQRVIDLKNSTNEGGLAFSPTNVFDGGWGNP